MHRAVATARRRRRARGATLVEYLLLVGLVGLIALAGFRVFGQTLRGKQTSMAQCVRDLGCNSSTGNPGSVQAPALADPKAAPGAKSVTSTSSALTADDARKPAAPMTAAQAEALMQRIARREANAQRPGVLFDPETGLTYDSHPIDPKTGEIVGSPTPFSAASKESLDVTLLAKAIAGDATARLALSQTGDPSDAVRVALDRLERKIDSYADFNRRYPGFGGFVPWFAIEGAPGKRRMVPASDWKTRVPALDNGELAWSLYYASRVLHQSGHDDLAAKYDAELGLMRKNVVRVFYEPSRGALRAEAEIGSTALPPERNVYRSNPKNPYYLDDSSEGLAMVHFADLYGDWRRNPGGRDALWAKPRREPAVFTTQSGERITVVKEWTFSSHEEWAYMTLPTRDVPIANQLFENAQRVRTTYAAESGMPGLFASTHVPSNDAQPGYIDTLGIPSVAASPATRADPIYAPYAAFPVALVDKPVAAAWLDNMTSAPRSFGPNGIGESTSGDGKAIAPVISWDGTAPPLVAWSGGITSDVREGMKADGVYDRFTATVQGDYRKFDGVPIEGTSLPLRTPTVAFPRGSSDFASPPAPPPASSAPPLP